MILGEEHEDLNIILENTKRTNDTDCQYLGTIMQKKEAQEKDTNNRIQKTLQLHYAMSKQFINKRDISIEIKIKAFDAMLTYEQHQNN